MVMIITGNEKKMNKIPARFDKIDEIKKLFPKDFPVVGVGVTALQRSGLGYILPNYSILSLLETSDLKAIRKICPAVSVEKGLGGECPQKFNTSAILADVKVKNWLKDKKGLFVYKASKSIDRLAGDLGLKLMSTPGEIRQKFENKKEFRIEAKKAGIRVPKGETMLVDELDEKKWNVCRAKYGEKLVFQLTDYTVGGGLGTFFISSTKDFQEFKDFVARRRQVRQEAGKVIEWVNVCEYIFGRQASITGCATKQGVVTSVLQAQVMDQPELAALQGRSGVWLGHDWNVRFSLEEQSQAEKLCRQWGEYMYKHGYKGIFGLDVMVPLRQDYAGQVVAVECNSRYTGAFPVYTMMQLAQKETPLDVWHLLEWMGVDYEMDIEEVQRVAREPKKGAHIILHNLERRLVISTRTVKAGVYRVKSGKAEWVREGFSLMEIQSNDELVLADRLPTEECVLKPAERLGKLMFKRQIVDEAGRLLPEIREVVKGIYNSFELMPVEKPEIN